MSSGKWGCLGAVVVSGVGLTLFGLGFDSHTTEAMPFGAALLLVGVIVGVPSLQALRGAVGSGLRPFPKLLMFALLTFCVGLELSRADRRRWVHRALRLPAAQVR